MAQLGHFCQTSADIAAFFWSENRYSGSPCCTDVCKATVSTL